MQQKVRLSEYVNPDGVHLYPNWDDLEVGMSLFIPAVNLSKLNKQVQRIVDSKGWTIKQLDRIENGRLGVRVWRIL